MSYIKNFKNYKPGGDINQAEINFDTNSLENEFPYNKVIKKIKSNSFIDLFDIVQTGNKLYELIMNDQIKHFEFKQFIEFIYLSKYKQKRVIQGSLEFIKEEKLYAKQISIHINNELLKNLRYSKQLEDIYFTIQNVYKKTYWIDEFWKNKNNELYTYIKKINE